MNKKTCSPMHKGCPPAQKCSKAKPMHVACDADSYYPYGSVYVPTILADVHLQADIEANVKLPTPAREIKAIKKNVSLKQCEVLKHPYAYNKVKLYITGIVHKNIQYVESCNGYLRDYSVDVPFTCSDEVDIFHYVDQYKSEKSSLNAEYKFLAKDKHGADRCKNGSFTYEYFNEPIDCVLKYADVYEMDLSKDFDKYGNFSRITEKMDVNLWFKLVQNQEKFSYLGGDVPLAPETDEEPAEEAAAPKSMIDRIQDRINRMS
jgi:hypothetical protein